LFWVYNSQSERKKKKKKKKKKRREERREEKKKRREEEKEKEKREEKKEEERRARDGKKIKKDRLKGERGRFGGCPVSLRFKLTLEELLNLFEKKSTCTHMSLIDMI